MVKIPAKYKTVKVKQIKTPAQTRSVPVPAEYQWVSTQLPVGGLTLDTLKSLGVDISRA